MGLAELATHLQGVAAAGASDARCSKEVHARYVEAVAETDPSASLGFFWWLADRLYTFKEYDHLVYEAFYSPETAKKEQGPWDQGLQHFSLFVRQTLWNRNSMRQIRSKPPSLQIRFIEACLDFSSHEAKARYDILLVTYYPYTRFFEIVLEDGAHVVICVTVREARIAEPVTDRYERKANAPIGMSPDEDLMRVTFSWKHEVLVIGLCSQGAVRQAVDQQMALLKRAANISTAWGAPAPALPPKLDKRPSSFWRDSFQKTEVGIPLMMFATTTVYEGKNDLRKRTDVVLREAEKGKEGDYDFGMEVLQRVLCTDDYCRQLVGVVEETSGVDLQLSPQEEGVLSLPNNVIIIGRSGTGKTTCAVLRLWAKYQQLSKLREGVDPDVPADCGLPFNGIFVTLSPVLSAQVKSFYSGLGSSPELPGEADVDTLRSSLRASGHEDMDDFEASSDAKGASLLDFPEEAPVFCSLKELLFALDSTLAFPFFAPPADAKTTSSGWSGLSDAAADLCAPESDHGIIPDDDDFDDDVMGTEFDERKPEARVMGDITYESFRSLFPAGNTGIHPSLVWTEIFSYIKGSRASLCSSKGYLTEDEYLASGRKQSPLTPAQKRNVYGIFLQYEAHKRRYRYFDIQDVVFHIFREIRARGYTGPPIHSITIDEVQDFSVSTLQLLMEVCKVPGGFFCTGDSAQTIARGAGFRFGDLRSVFYHRQVTHRVYGDAFKVPDIHQLTTNYRSHRQLHNMAHSVVHLLECLFPEAIDKLSPDSGTRDGPKPTYVCSSEMGPIFQLLFGEQGGERQQFGAKQVIIVRDDCHKELLPEELKPCLCLTVFEAKGLEFDDVILFNFFNDSSCTGWEPVGPVEPCPPPASSAPLVQTSFEQLSVGSLDTGSGKRRPIQDMASDRGMLCSELKHLYTAITRAKNRLVLVETSESFSCDTMVDYWRKTDLLASPEEASANIKPAECTEEERRDQWHCQGLEMLRRSYFAQALKCFTYSGDEDLQIRCKAFMKASTTAPTAKEQRANFEQAAELFLKIDFKNRAAHCLASAGQFSEAGELYELAFRYRQAASAFSKASRWEDAARCAFTAGQTDEGRRFLERAGAWKELMDSCQHIKLSDRIDIARRCTIKALWRSYPALSHLSVPRGGKELVAVLASGLDDGKTAERVQFVRETFCQRQELPTSQLALLLCRINAPCLAARMLLASGQRDSGAEQEVAVLAVQQISMAALKCYEFQPEEKQSLLIEVASLLHPLQAARLLGLHGYWQAAGMALWNAGAYDEARSLLICAGKPAVLAELCGDAHPLWRAEAHVVGTLSDKRYQGDPCELKGQGIPSGLSEAVLNRADAFKSATAVMSLQKNAVSRATLLRLYAASAGAVLKLKPKSLQGKVANGIKACTSLVLARIKALLACVRGVWSVFSHTFAAGPPPSPAEVTGYLEACQLAGLAVPNHSFSLLGMKIGGSGMLEPMSDGEVQAVVNASEGALKKCLNFLLNSLRAPLDQLLSLGELLLDLEGTGHQAAQQVTESALLRITAIASRSKGASRQIKKAVASFCHKLFGSGRGSQLGFVICKCLSSVGASLEEFYAQHFEMFANNEALASQCKAYLALHCGDARAAWAHWLDYQEHRDLSSLSVNDLEEWRAMVLYASSVLSGAANSPCDGCRVPRSIAQCALKGAQIIAKEETMEFMQSLLDRFCVLTVRVLDELDSRASVPSTTWAFGSFVAVVIYNCGLPPHVDSGIEAALNAWVETDRAQPLSFEAFVRCCQPYQWAPDTLEEAFRNMRDAMVDGPITCTLSTTEVQSKMSVSWEAVRRGSASLVSRSGKQSAPHANSDEARAAFKAVCQAARAMQEERQSFLGQDGGSDLCKLFQCLDVLCASLAGTETMDPVRITDAVQLLDEIVGVRRPVDSGPTEEEALRQKEVYQQRYAAKQKNRQKQEFIQERKQQAKKQRRAKR